MAVEVVRKLINGLWRTVAEEAGGNGGSTPFVGVFAGKTTDTELSAGVPETIVLDEVLYDTDGFFDVVDGVLVVPAGKGGLYRAAALGTFEATGTPGAILQLQVKYFRANSINWSPEMSQVSTEDLGYTVMAFSTAAYPLDDGDGVHLLAIASVNGTITGNGTDTSSVTGDWDTLYLVLERVGDTPTLG